MSFSFCFGPSGAGKSAFLRKMIIGKAEVSMRDPLSGRKQYIFIVPEQYSMQTQRELVLDHPAHVLMNIDVLSFGRLAHRVFEETGVDQRIVLDDIGKSLLLRRVCSRCEKKLQVLSRGIHKPGMIDEIKSVLSEFMQYGIGEEQIFEMADYASGHGQNALSARLRDMQLLLKEFKAEERDRYVTGEETLDLLAASICRAESLQNSVIVFDGFTGFTPSQYRVVLELLRCAEEAYFSFTISNDTGPDIEEAMALGLTGSEKDLFYLTRRTVRDILKMAKEKGIRHGEDIYLPSGPDGCLLLNRPVSDSPGEKASGSEGRMTSETLEEGLEQENYRLFRFRNSRVLAHLEKSIFRHPMIPFSTGKREGKGDSYCGIRLFAASSPREEVGQIFSRIRDIIRGTGCAYRDFAIVTADLETYGDLFELEAGRCRIPVYIDRTSGVFHNILIEGIRGVLQISAESFSYASVFRYLRSGLSRLTNTEVDLLENYCLAHGVRGKRRWSMPFDASCEEARLRFLKEVEPVTGETRGSGARTAGVRTRELYDFLVQCKAQERAQSLADEFGKNGDVVREKQYRQIYRAVIDLLDQIYGLAGQDRMSTRDYLELLEAGFSQIRLGTLPQRADRVLVGDMERTRLTQIRYLFFAGANEGNIPRSASRGGILSDMDREFLARSGAVLAPTPRQQIFTQRLYLYLNMTKPSELLTVSYSKSTQDKKSLRPSYLVTMLRNLFPDLKTEVPREGHPGEIVLDRTGGQSLLAEKLRCFVEGQYPEGTKGFESFRLLYGFYTSPEVMADQEVGKMVLRLRNAALYRYRPRKLKREIAAALYGSSITGGISRMETAANCLLRHHLRYGLALKERDLYEYAPVDEGTILHEALRRFDLALGREGLSWRSFSMKDAGRLGGEVLRKEAALYRDLLLFKSCRDERRLDRLERRLLRTVGTLQYQICRGDLDPVASELSFGGDGSVENSMPAIRFDLGRGRRLFLVGRIDRVDMYVEEGRRFIRIMDYKTGKNDLDEDMIRRGLRIQLITYMEALRNADPAILNTLAGAPGESENIPSALLYYQMTEPVVSLSAQEAVKVLRTDRKFVGETESGPAGEEASPGLDMIRKKLRPTGLVYEMAESIAHLDRFFEKNSDVIPVGRTGKGYSAASRIIDPDKYQELAQAARDAVCVIADRILDGRVDASPAVLDKKKTSCTYCPYIGACGFDMRIHGYTLRREL